MKTLLIIPAYNEEESIGRVVDQLREGYSQFDYVIVDDGSRDRTAAICRERGYRFLELPLNLGLAGAFQAGVKFAQREGYDCVVQFDADGQHLPEYLDGLVAALEHCDIAIGSRFVTEKKPRSLRMFGNSLITAMIKVTCGQTIHDPTSGLRAYNRRAIDFLASGPNLGPEPDTLSYLMKKKGIRVEEVQVSMAERQAGESYLNIKNSAAYMARMAFSVLVIQLFR